MAMASTNSPTYKGAVAAEAEGKYHQALRLYQSILSAANNDTSNAVDANDDKKRSKDAIQRLIDFMYGPKGSDETICIWKNSPLMSKSLPPPLQFRAYCQMDNKIYVHGGCDFCQNDTLPISDDVWQYDMEDRKWSKVSTGGITPGPRTGHTMFPWRGDLYLWGGMQEVKNVCRVFDSKLYRLNLSSGNRRSNNGKHVFRWEIVKVRSQEPDGRDEHAAVLYKGRYYIHGGNNPHVDKKGLNDMWVLNLSNFKWSRLKNGPVARHCHGMWAANNRLYVLGGRINVNLSCKGPKAYLDSSITNPCIEDFVSFDLESKTWKYEECVGDIRPHPLSEFPVLPLYDNDQDEDPSSILIWGGYAEPVKHDNYKAVYGDEEDEFRLPYRKRLLRFDVSTNVWKSLEPTSPILPKALAIMATKKSENGVRHVLIGEGYGIDPETSFRKLTAKSKAEWQDLYEQSLASGISNFPSLEEMLVSQKNGCRPQYSHQIYDVQITETFGSRCNKEKSGWSYDIYNLPDEELPQVVSELTPCSSTLHHVLDMSIDDFVTPSCVSVAPNDEKNLLGARVKIHGLKGRKDLNGMIGRCGRWLQKSARYEVFLPLYECGKNCGSLSVKVENLQIAEPVTDHNILDIVMSNPHTPKAFPAICFFLLRVQTDQRPFLDHIIDPISVQSRKMTSYMDTYRGPLSSRAHVVIRRMILIKPSLGANSSGVYCCLIPATDIGLGKKASTHDVYSNFVKDLKEKDTVRVGSFESALSNIGDEIIDEKCGGWLNVIVEMDGIRPHACRELLVNPSVTMRALHDQVLCPSMGWKSNFHCYAFRKMYDDPEKLKESCWIGPRQSTALDSMFMPLYIGACLANDKQITIGQLFASEDTDTLTLQWVHDFGDWYSHHIEVSKYDGQSSPDSSVAFLVRGEGMVCPEDSGGPVLYSQMMRKLTGRMPIKINEENNTEAFVDPDSEHWWRYFNDEVRKKHNMQAGFGNPLQFNLERARDDLEAAIRRPTQKSGREVQNLSTVERKTGLTREQDKTVTASLPKNATKMCAVCGVTVALRNCSACESIAYCSREHRLRHWKEHKTDCKLIQKSRK